MAAAESFEFVNVAEQPEHAGTVSALHAQLLAIRTGLVKPVRLMTLIMRDKRMMAFDCDCHCCDTVTQ